MNVEALLHSIPPLLVYLVVGGVVGVESLGVPLPGEIVLVSAALMSSHHDLAINPICVGLAAVIGAVVGDSIGYTIGRKFGMPLFDRLGRRFPKHFGPGHVLLAEKLFTRWGARAVFFGRFIALLRIFAGPLAGALKMPYPRFLVGQCFRWHLLGRRHHRARLLRRNGRRTLDGAILLDRAGHRGRVSAPSPRSCCANAHPARSRNSRRAPPQRPGDQRAQPTPGAMDLAIASAAQPGAGRYTG